MQDGDDEPLRLGADLAGPTFEAGGRPLGVVAVGARHVLGIGAVPLAAMAPIVGSDALAAMEHLDRAGGEPDLDLLADQRVGHRVEEAGGLDITVEIDPGQPSLGEDVVDRRQGSRAALSMTSNSARRVVSSRRMRWALMRSTIAAMAALHSTSWKKVCLHKRPRLECSSGKADAVLHLRLVTRLLRPGWQHADAVVGGRHSVGPVDLGIVEGRLVDPLLSLSGTTRRGTPPR